jgi:ABC-type transporter Mla subunit MlaD
MKKNLAVGFFVVGALAVALFAVFRVNDLAIRSGGGYPLTVRFTYADGLKPASPVRFAGVAVGQVKTVVVHVVEKKVVVDASVRIGADAQIPKGSQFVVNNLRLLGEKYLEIVPPVTVEGDAYYAPGEIVLGNDSVPLYEVSKTTKESLTRLSTVLDSLTDFLGDKKALDTFGGLLKNLEHASAELDDMLESVNQRKGTIGKLIYEDELYTDVSGLAADVRAHPWKLIWKTKEKKTAK